VAAPKLVKATKTSPAPQKSATGAATGQKRASGQPAQTRLDGFHAEVERMANEIRADETLAKRYLDETFKPWAELSDEEKWLRNVAHMTLGEARETRFRMLRAILDSEQQQDEQGDVPIVEVKLRVEQPRTREAADLAGAAHTPNSTVPTERVFTASQKLVTDKLLPPAPAPPQKAQAEGYMEQRCSNGVCIGKRA